MLRAINLQSTWPERLSFTVVYNNETYPVQTQLVGTHWGPCVLAALAVGVTMGVPLSAAAEAVQSVAPVKGRLCPEFFPNDITFIRDDVKAPLWSIPPALKIMQDAKAKRKIVVIGTISDYAREFRPEVSIRGPTSLRHRRPCHIHLVHELRNA